MRARTLPTSHPQQLQAAHKDHTLRQRHANVRANKTRAAKHLMGDPMPGGGGSRRPRRPPGRLIPSTEKIKHFSRKPLPSTTFQIRWIRRPQSPRIT